MKQEYNTDRLSLTQISLADAAFIKELVNTPGWIRFIGERNVKTDEDALQYIQKIIDSNNISYWTVKMCPGLIAIGVISFIKRDYLPYHDIGFAFLPQYYGNGYAYEAAKTVLNDVMRNEQHPIVLATTLYDNFNSIKVLKKMGFSYSHTLNVKGEDLLVHAIYV